MLLENVKLCPNRSDHHTYLYNENMDSSYMKKHFSMNQNPIEYMESIIETSNGLLADKFPPSPLEKPGLTRLFDVVTIIWSGLKGHNIPIITSHKYNISKKSTIALILK